ncbi:hypothetical protein T01_14146 [Trichinella spiralis]|uniref:Uncharacterized protein n=1 Tax=Trichinella spiralis TaxID=6334 RepID=A0A0V1B1H5_TRISP|nr:hypothetical protein T01_14146 [Trichinella spiralis]
MFADKECFIMHIGWIFVLCFSFLRYSVATSKCYDLNGNMEADWKMHYENDKTYHFMGL